MDRRILARYQQNTRRIAASIGSEIGLSAAAVQRRIKRLRASGAIRAEVAILDPRAVGVLITCVVLLTMVSRAGPVKHLARFKRDMTRLPEVQQCYYVTAREWFESNDNVMRYQTLVVLDRVKAGVSLPVATE